MTKKTHGEPGARDLGLRPHCGFGFESFPAPRGDVMVLRVLGAIDAASLPALRDWLEVSRRRVGSHLVVDLSGVDFCSARGFAVLAGAADHAAETGIGYALAGCSAWFEQCWSILPLADVQRYRNLADAVMDIRTDQTLTNPA